jgi:hypothetical protein
MGTSKIVSLLIETGSTVNASESKREQSGSFGHFHGIKRGSNLPGLLARCQILHQPLGLTTPSTIWQVFGRWNWAHLEQLWLPFGESRYPDAAFVIFAAAGLVVMARTGTAPLA